MRISKIPRIFYFSPHVMRENPRALYKFAHIARYTPYIIYTICAMTAIFTPSIIYYGSYSHNVN